jgi:hypothetical protein
VYFVQPLNSGDEPFGYSVRRQSTYRMPRAHAEAVAEQFENLHRLEIRSMLATLGRCGFGSVYMQDWLKDMQEANAMLPEPLNAIDLSKVYRNAKQVKVKVDGRESSVYIDEQKGEAYLSYLETFNDETVDELREKKLKVFLNRPSTYLALTEDPAVARFMVGVYLWRLKADGIVMGPARWSWGDPYQPFDGYGGEHGSLLMPASREWPAVNTSRVLEEVREGINDYRYLVTLEKLIETAGARPEAAQAEAFLQELRKHTSGTLSDYIQSAGGSGWRVKPGEAWGSERFNRLRRDLAGHISGLGDVLKIPLPAITPAPGIWP